MEKAATTLNDLWKRIPRGQHTAFIGPSLPEPPAALGLFVVHVRCDVPQTTLGPLLDARHKIDRLLGGDAPLLDQARERVVAGLRRRLLGDMPAHADGVDLVEAANRMAAHFGSRCALVFEAAEAADPATIETLRKILARPGWLKLPIVLWFRDEPKGDVTALLDALSAAEGAEAVLREAPPAAAEEGMAPPAIDWRTMPPDVLRVLRAGALVGSGFEVGLVAALLNMNVLDALEAIQRAADLGVPLVDRGEGRFHLPEPLLASLRASTLPSLALVWHRMLASLLRTEPAAESVALGEPPAPIAEPQPSSPASEAPPAAQAPEAAPPSEEAPYAEMFGESAAPQKASETEEAEARADGAADADADAPPSEAPRPGSFIGGFTWLDGPPRSEPASRPDRPIRIEVASRPETNDAPEPSTRPPSSHGAHLADDARAASHLAAAGEVEASAERYRAAAEKAAGLGAFTQAFAHGQRAIQLIEGLPLTRERRRLRAQLHADLGRLQWQAPGPDPAFTLRRALAALEKARALVAPEDPPALRTEIATLIASVCYDLGDMRSLERALDELTRETRALLDAGDAVGAARLLNDQAAVYVRMGDPVRAVHLLTESRTIFEQRAPNEPVAMLELAETDHLLARIPLHVPPRPGRESDALSMGLDHALAAERTYKKLGMMRELGRVWETMGRLELRKGRLERASERLSASLSLGQQIGDVVGLARSAAAMSEVLAASGRYRDAAALLGDSIALNLEKGSPIGLAHNRHALESLARRSASDPAAQRALATVAERLASAESLLGRLSLPGERG